MNPKAFAKKIAEERLWRLFELAGEVFEENPARANDYVKRARQVATYNRVRFPFELKVCFCKKCGAFWKEGKNVSVEESDGMRVSTCGACKAVQKNRLP